VVGGVLAAAGSAVSSLGAWIAGVLMLLAIPLFALGFIWAYYLPALPFLLFWGGVINWLILVVEALVAAPLWIAAHAMPEGDCMAANAGRQGYMLCSIS
jgi:conjugal transfer/type IV secretion protein DotA/TraY